MSEFTFYREFYAVIIFRAVTNYTCKSINSLNIPRLSIKPQQKFAIMGLVRNSEKIFLLKEYIMFIISFCIFENVEMPITAAETNLAKNFY